MSRSRTPAAVCVVLLGVPFCIRLAFLFLWNHAFTWGDGLFYAAIAEQFYRFGWLHDYLFLFPPGYPAAVAAARILLPLDAALAGVSCVAGAVVPALVWWIASRTADQRTAWFAFALACCSPLLIGLSMERLADCMFIALLVGALAAFVCFFTSTSDGLAKNRSRLSTPPEPSPVLGRVTEKNLVRTERQPVANSNQDGTSCFLPQDRGRYVQSPVFPQDRGRYVQSPVLPRDRGRCRRGLILRTFHPSTSCLPVTSEEYKWIIVYSICSALAVQTKPEALVLVFVQSVLLLAVPRFQFRKRILCCGSVWVIIALIGSPYWFWLHQRTGDWILSGKAPLNLMHARAKALTDDHAEELRMVYSEAFALDESGELAFLSREDGFVEYLITNPGCAASVYWENVTQGIQILSPASMPLLLCVVMGGAWFWTRRERFLLLVLLSPLVLLVFPPFFVTLAQPSFHPGRLAGPVLPSLILVAACGLSGWTETKRRLALWILIAWCFAALVLAFHQTARLDRANRTERRLLDLHRERVTSWLQENTSTETIIASTSLLDDAYGGRRSVWLPWEETPKLFEYLHRRRVGCVIQEAGGGIFSPGFEGPEADPASYGFQPVDTLDLIPQVVIYRSDRLPPSEETAKAQNP